MTAALLIKLWRDARWLLAGCIIVQFAFAAVRVWFISQLDASRFEQILELLPGDVQKWTPVEFEWIVSYAGRVSFTFQEPLVHFILFVWCVARGSDAVSGEIDRGTMEMMISQPLSRTRYLACHAALTVLGVIAISAALWLGMACAVLTLDANVLEFPTLPLGFRGWELPLPFAPPIEKQVPLSQLVDLSVLTPAIASFAAFGVLLAAFTTAVSSGDRYRWRTIGIAASVYIIETILKMLSTVVPWLHWLTYTTVFSAFEPEKYVSIADLAPESTWAIYLQGSSAAAGRAASGLGAGGSILLFITLAAICYTIAFRVFQKRDLPAPI